MKSVSNQYKTNLVGARQVNYRITNVTNGEVLNPENFKKIRIITNSDLLCSTMKEIEIHSVNDISIGEILNVKFGLRVDYHFTDDTEYQAYTEYYSRSDDIYTLLIEGIDYEVGDAITTPTYVDYELIDYGDYNVYESEYEADTKTYRLTCYDNMLYAMQEYQHSATSFPTTILHYLQALANNIGLYLPDTTFVNYDKVLESDPYVDNMNRSLGYTYRDIFDEISQATASNICISNSGSHKLEVRYINQTNEIFDEHYLKNINVTFGEIYGPVNSIVLTRSADSDSIYKRDEQSIEQNGLTEIKIRDNQILNGNNRDEYISPIANQLMGLEYYINDFDSFGITYLDLCDMYGVEIENQVYNCLLLNDEITIEKGIFERTYTDKQEDTITDYTKSDKTDRKINQAYLMVDKQNQTIEALTSRTDTIENKQDIQYSELINKFNDYAPMDSLETITTQVTQLQTDTYTKTQVQQIANGTGVDGVTVTAVISTEAQFDADGMHYSKTDAPTSSTIDYKGFEVDDTNSNEIFYSGYDENPNSSTYGSSIVRTQNINVKTYLQCANEKGRIEEFEDANGNVGVGFFLM